MRWDLETALNDSEQSRNAVVYEVCEPPLPRRQAFCRHWVGSWQAIWSFACPCGLGGRIGGGWLAARSETREAWCLSITATFRVLMPETAYFQGQKTDPKLFQGAVKNHAEADSATAAPPSGVTSPLQCACNARLNEPSQAVGMLETFENTWENA